MAKIYYVGDWAVLMGPLFAETPFNYTRKGTEIHNYGTWLKAALESSGEHQVDSVPTWEFYKLGPGQYEQILADDDVIVFSDVESKNFQLAPSFFDRAKFGKRQLSFPDRVRLIVEAVRAGKAMMFLGGWLSFNGECGKGGWGRTGLKEILPVKCLDIEDLRESTEGYRAEPAAPDHPFFKGLDISAMPLVLGYNIVQPREGCQVLAAGKRSAAGRRPVRQGARAGLHLRPRVALGLQFRLLGRLQSLLTQRLRLAAGPAGRETHRVISWRPSSRRRFFRGLSRVPCHAGRLDPGGPGLTTTKTFNKIIFLDALNSDNRSALAFRHRQRPADRAALCFL